LVSSLALAIAMLSGSSQAAHGTFQPQIAAPSTGQLMLREAIAGGDTRHAGWQPSRLQAGDESTALIDAWRARRPEHVVPVWDGSRGGVNRVVTNCNDAGAGSLRAVVDIANTGDTIDLTQLACGTITLTTGEIVIPDNDIDIIGPGADQMTIDGNENSAVLVHTGLGTLVIDGVEIRDGLKYADSGGVAGGCVFSLGSVSLFDSEVNSCTLWTTAGDSSAFGGGVYAQGNVVLSNSLVSGNTSANKYSNGIEGAQGGSPRAYGGGVSSLGSVTVISSLVVNNGTASTESSSYGGGIHANGGLLAKYSQFSDNAAGNGGGLAVRGTGDITIQRSTISGNEASIAGGAYVSVDGAAGAISINNSTVSGNTAENKYAGLMVGGDDSEKTINATTITGNLSESADVGAGLQLFAGALVEMRSTIVSGNQVDQGGGIFDPSDIGSSGSGALVLGGPFKNNLVLQSDVPLPNSTIIGLAKVSSLRDNGGPTPTHALRGNSVALDNGTSALDDSTDQRASGFERIIGASADIGAFEFDLSDLVFADDYDDEDENK
jgi:hypothetical protein